LNPGHIRLQEYLPDCLMTTVASNHADFAFRRPGTSRKDNEQKLLKEFLTTNSLITHLPLKSRIKVTLD
jgi:hypothetical protein